MPSQFNLNSLKGRLAEQLIKDLFIKSGYNVFNYGLETLHPSLSKTLRTNSKGTSMALRFMPDFVVQSATNGDLFYLEVKYRSDGYFEFDKNYVQYPYKNAWFVIVSPAKINCMHYKLLSQGKYISEKSKSRLSNLKYFHIPENLLAEYEGYAATLFTAFRQ